MATRSPGFQLDPVLLTKTWINPTQARVVMEPLSAFGEKVVNDAFGDRVTITRVDKMPERRSMSRSPLPEIRRSTSRSPLPEIRKSSRSPINPVELRGDKRQAPERRLSAGSCASHNGTTPRQQKRALDILNLPGTVNSSRSPSPSERRRKKSGGGSSRGSRSGSGHHILDECDNDKWSAKPRNTPSPRPTKPRSSRRKTERHELYDADRRSPMPPRRSPRPDERTSRGPKSRGKSKESERDASMERERVPSARSRRLYRNEFYYSDGFTESASSDDWPTPTKKKSVKSSKKDSGKESKKSKKGIDPSKPKSIIGIAAISKAAMLAKGARKPEADDPWGGNSPMRRIEKLEASFGPDQEGPMDHSELELEDEILQEVEETLESHGSPTETEVEDVGGGRQMGGRSQPFIEPTIVLSTEYELPVYDSHPTKESMNLTMLGTFGEKEQDGDSCLGLSIDDRSSAPSTEPQSRIQAAFALEEQEEDKGRFVFEPLPMLQVVGRVRDTATGEVFEVYTDGPPPPVKDFDGDTFTVGSSKSEDEEEEEDVGWCSCYFFIRAIGLVCVVGLIAGLILLSIYGR